MPWDLGQVFSMTHKDIWEPLGFEFWRDLAPQPWCHEVIRLLTDRFGEKNICLLTSPVDTEGCVEGKRAWMRNHTPQFRRRFLIGPAKEFTAGTPKHCLVDDSDTNIDTFKEAEGSTFLFPAPWNGRFKEHPVEALQKWIDGLDISGS
jgi:5'(3')-deoxyribonucleotidase